MDLMNTKPADIKADIEQRKTDRQVAKATDVASKPTPLEKAAVEDAQAASMFATQLAGGGQQEQMANATAVREAAAGAQLDVSVNTIKAGLAGDGQIVDVAAGMAKAQEGQVLKENKALTTSFSDQIGAAFSEMTAIPALLRMIDRPDETIDPNFDYMAIRDKAEAGRPEADRQWLRESTSEADLNQKLVELQAKDERYKVIGAHGTGLAVASSLTGGLLDPVGILAGLGVGKVAQLGNVGVKLYKTQALAGLSIREGADVAAYGLSQAAKAPTSLVQNVAEGVAGNVLYEATLDAAGQHVTFSDYVISAGFGAMFGAGIHAIRGGSRNRPGEEFGPVGDTGRSEFVGPRSPKKAAVVQPEPVAPRTDLNTGADFNLRDGTPVVATIKTDKWGDSTVELQTKDGTKVGSVDYGPLDAAQFPQPHVEEAFRRRGANTLMYDLINENGGYTGERGNTRSARTTDGQAFWDGYTPGQSADWRNKPALMTPKQAAEDIAARAQEQNMDLYTQAQARAGEGATPDEIRTAADSIMQEQADQITRIAHAEVPEQDRFFPTFDLAVREDGTVPQIDEVMLPAAERIAVSDRWGINMNTVEDGTERKMLGELAARAEGWASANPVDPERINSILARVPWLASSGLNLARSENPVARMIAGVLLESTTGATGRRRTAAITKTMRERQYLEPLVGYEEAYRQWRKTNGGSAYRDVIGSKHRSDFDRLVANHRENRRLGVSDEANPHVSRGADYLDTGYNHMRKDQQTIGTIGAQRLGDTSIGYVHRALSQSWVMGASNAEIKALSNKLAEQLQVGWDDVQFARQIATRYVERARTGAYGGTSVPANLASPEAAGVLRDVLRSMSVGEADIEKAMGRFARGGASHTKKRLDLDLSEHVDLPDGTSFPLMHAFETDQAGLYLQYARRVSGDVALTQYGVHGDQGMKVLRKAMEYGPDGKRATVAEMESFDQIAAEFFGRPMDGTGNKHLGNLRMLTAASRLGGMAFTQFAEMANSVSLLGVTGALKNVAAMPKLIGQVHRGEKSELLASIEQIGGPLGQDHRVVFPFQEPNDIKVYGRDSLNAFDRMVRAGSNALPWLSGWHMVHAAQVRGISEQIVHKSLRYINQGEENAALTSMGLSPELAARLKADMPNIAAFDDAGKLIKLDLTKATDHGAAAEFVQAVHRGGKQIIQGTYIGETGKWAHNDLMRLLVQFRSFTLTSMEKQWTRQRSDVGTAKAFGLLMGQMAFALPIHLSRVAINATGRENKDEYLETQLHPAMLARAVLNYTSISGLSGDVLDAGASVLGYEASGVRGGSGSILGNVPSLGYVESAGKVIKNKDPREAIRMLPGGNLPFITPVVNTLAE